MSASAFVRAFALAALGACALSLSGCGEPVRGLDPDKKILDIGNGAEPASLDPQKATGTWESNVIGNMFTGLTTEDAKGRVIPGMAERWETSDDGLTWTFFLRDANWSDGEPVTAYDFEFAFRRILDPINLAEYAPLLYPIKNAQKVNEGKLPPSEVGVRAIDEKTLEIDLEHATPFLPQLLMHQTTYPIPKHVVEKWGDDWIKPAHIEVNGAFKLVRWWSNYEIHLVKNPRFYDAGNVCLNDLYFYPATDTDAEVRRVENHELGWATNFPGTKIDMLKKEMPAFIHTAPYLLTSYLSINLARKPFDDPRVRRALSMSIDREFLVKNIFKSGYLPAYQFVPPGMPHYDQGGRMSWRDMPLEQRRAEALRLLKEAGFGPGHPLRFQYSFGSGGDQKAPAAIQEDWHSLAPWVMPELHPVETQIHYNDMRAKNFDVGGGGWVADYTDPQNYLYLLETSTGSQNYPGYSNPQYDALMAQADHEPDVNLRAGLMAKAEQIMLDDDPVIPIVIGSSRNLVDPRLTGFEDNIADVHRARWMCITG